MWDFLKDADRLLILCLQFSTPPCTVVPNSKELGRAKQLFVGLQIHTYQRAGSFQLSHLLSKGLSLSFVMRKYAKSIRDCGV